MMKSTVLLVSILAAQSAGAVSADEHARQIEEWRNQRSERLRAPGGWLSLVGLDWLKPGRNTVGSAAGNDIVIAAAPAHLGAVIWSDGKVVIELADGVDARIDGERKTRAELLDDSNAKPTLVAFGTTHFYPLDRSGRKALRVKDSEAPTRTGFLGIDNYPVDASWRIEARWIPFDPPQTLDIPNITGQIEKMTVPGKAVFEREGRTWELLPVLDSPDAKQLFFIFADKTSAKTTYGAGRFLYSDFASNGMVVIDFNKAYNPPCALSPHVVCPTAPPENRLGLRVTAGEKKYAVAH